ncbi:unnamed protein product [Nesidiocoris tenuis]|uniref:Uncharacterized protein n=1 Tax=Nesidiocoris tenuis TaxID=355587 RepID=A0A6H5H0N0_9HEMI|nr:unnamed protein product [Nesidiocoris tenuis]
MMILIGNDNVQKSKKKRAATSDTPMFDKGESGNVIRPLYSLRVCTMRPIPWASTGQFLTLAHLPRLCERRYVEKINL